MILLWHKLSFLDFNFVMLLGFRSSIWFYREPVDFRKQIDGLVILVSDTLKKDPVSGQLFVFRNRSGNKIKLLVWDNAGFWLMYKRMENNRFKFPLTGEKIWDITYEQFLWLLSGLDFTKQKKLSPVKAKYFY